MEPGNIVQGLPGILDELLEYLKKLVLDGLIAKAAIHQEVQRIG